jgi:hypothetical protein
VLGRSVDASCSEEPAAVSSTAIDSKASWKDRADWFPSGADGYGRIDVRSNIRTTDDALIYMQYHGLVRLTPAALTMLNGEPDPAATTISISSPRPVWKPATLRYLWVNQTMFLGEGQVSTEPRVDYRIYRVT